MRNRWLMLIAIASVVLVLDQITKQLVLDSVPLGRTVQPIPALAPFFQVTYSQNIGAAFGFLPQASDLYPIIAVVVVTAMLYFYPRVPANGHLTRVAMGMICGGALGNALDRLEHGFVVDFIHYQIPNLISNVSNVADHGIVLGVLLIFLDGWLLERQEKRMEQTIPLEADTSDEG